MKYYLAFSTRNKKQYNSVSALENDGGYVLFNCRQFSRDHATELADMLNRETGRYSAYGNKFSQYVTIPVPDPTAA